MFARDHVVKDTILLDPEMGAFTVELYMASPLSDRTRLLRAEGRHLWRLILVVVQWGDMLVREAAR